MFRGVEVGAVLCRDVRLLPREQTVVIRVSSSKTDLRARGFSIRWRCICAAPQIDTPHLYPFHILESVAIGLHGTVAPDDIAQFFTTVKKKTPVTLSMIDRVLGNIKRLAAIALPDLFDMADAA